MFKLYKGFARFTTRTPVAQAQNAIKDENEQAVHEILEATPFESGLGHNEAKPAKNTVFCTLKLPKNDQEHNHGNYRDYQFDPKVYRRSMWENLVFGSASVLAIARYLNLRLDERRRRAALGQKPPSYCIWTYLKQHSLSSRINGLCSSVSSLAILPINSALPRLSGCCNTALAAGFDEDSQQSNLSSSNSSAFNEEKPLGTKPALKKRVSIDPKFIKEESSTSSSESTLNVSSEDLDKFVSSTQQCIGRTFAIKGLAEYEAGKLRQAVESFTLASNEGYSQAQYNLALCYESGQGTQVNIERAKLEYKKASLQGHKEAQYNLALLYLDEESEVSTIHALYLLERAALQGMVEAQSLLGSRLAQPNEHQNMKKAVDMFTLAAEQEDTLSTYHLAECYEHGLGGLTVDSSHAYQLYASAAHQGHLEAQFKMASILLNGCEGVERNEKQALQIFEKGADLGHKASAKKYAELIKKQRSKRRLLINPQAEEDKRENEMKLTSSTSELLKLLMPEIMQNIRMDLMSENFIAPPSLKPDLFSPPLIDGFSSLSIVPSLHRVTTWPGSLAGRK